MKSKLARFITILLLIIALVVIAISRPWQYISIISPSSALSITTIAGKAEVSLNGRKIGDTPYSAENLKPGDYTLELKRASETKDFYYVLTKKIHLEADTRTVIKAEIGPSEQFTSFAVIYFQKSNTQQPQLFVKSQPANSKIWLQDIRYGETPITTTNIKAGTYQLKLEKDGYEPLEIQVQTQEGYILVADIELMAKPINIKIAD